MFCSTESLEPPLSAVMWKVENEFVAPAKDIYKQSIDSAAWILLAAYSKNVSKRHKLRERFLKRRKNFTVSKFSGLLDGKHAKINELLLSKVPTQSTGLEMKLSLRLAEFLTQTIWPIES